MFVAQVDSVQLLSVRFYWLLYLSQLLDQGRLHFEFGQNYRNISTKHSLKLKLKILYLQKWMEKQLLSSQALQKFRQNKNLSEFYFLWILQHLVACFRQNFPNLIISRYNIIDTIRAHLHIWYQRHKGIEDMVPLLELEDNLDFSLLCNRQ